MEHERGHQSLEDNDSAHSAASTAEQGAVLKVRNMDCSKRGFY